MDTAVALPPVEEKPLRAQFSFSEKDLRTYLYATRYYPRDLKVRGGRLTAQQEEACHALTRRLDEEIVRLCESVPPEGAWIGHVSITTEDAGLLEDALYFLADQIKATEGLCMAALERFQRETRLVLAVLATESQQ